MFRRGDAKNDGAVSPLPDALFLFQYGFGGGDTPPCMKAADVDGNNTVSALPDGLRLLHWQFIDADPPPAPGPDECGHDGDPDNDTDCADETACP